MKQNSYQELTNEALIKKRDLLKAVSIGFGIVFFLALAVLTYLFTTKDPEKASVATLIPVFMLPITFVPLLINLGLLSKEIKARNL
ncbi:hypothetical protein SAMN05444008_106184 [Cnuella takakiae]|uniref:Redox-active disulfide protein 2 n=1 Tax=Cnuella takakiae TaxID=1302690 RepID=A0A1M5AAF3_9BACT|nr:hypothetical protein [Cnuella takakiae]OLY92035.1 hypothetical protein BUE76_09095 [Cnuella takakiae]SHF27243.1 hypothetical protein SAMN05444008_106184 [Cnuella takakiae]